MGTERLCVPTDGMAVRSRLLLPPIHQLHRALAILVDRGDLDGLRLLGNDLIEFGCPLGLLARLHVERFVFGFAEADLERMGRRSNRPAGLAGLSCYSQRLLATL